MRRPMLVSSRSYLILGDSKAHDLVGFEGFNHFLTELLRLEDLTERVEVVLQLELCVGYLLLDGYG
jgi:hypothetical protein